MSDFVSALAGVTPTLEFRAPSASSIWGTGNDKFEGFDLENPSILETGTRVGAATFIEQGPAAGAEATIVSKIAEVTPAVQWFDKWHIVPRDFNVGNVLTDTTRNFEVHNAYRDLTQSWTSYTNNAGVGVDLVVESTLLAPSFPIALEPMTSIEMQLQIDSQGPPSVNTTQDFTFTQDFIALPIEFRRALLFVQPPLQIFREIMEFSTDVITSDDGTEQTIALRPVPRQIFEWDFFLEDGNERASIMNQIFAQQLVGFGFPMWHEKTFLTQEALTATNSVTVKSTAFADYRVGGLAMVYKDRSQFDILEVESITATTLTFTGNLANTYAAGAGSIVAPVRIGSIEGAVPGGRFQPGHADVSLRFRVDENDTADIASTAAFTSTYNSKVVIDDCNVIVNASVPEQLERNIFVFDSIAGSVGVRSNWDRGKRSHAKTFQANGKQRLWEIRQLIHALRGPQVSFYIPTFADDFVPTLGFTAGSDLMTIEDQGYGTFVALAEGRTTIQIEFNDGTPTLYREIIGATVSSPNEILQLDANFPDNKDLSTIKRVSYLEKVRFINDAITIEHRGGARHARVLTSVREVFQ